MRPQQVVHVVDTQVLGCIEIISGVMYGEGTWDQFHPTRMYESLELEDESIFIWFFLKEEKFSPWSGWEEDFPFKLDVAP